MEAKTLGILGILIAVILAVMFIPIMMGSVLDTRGSCLEENTSYYSVENDQCQTGADNTTYTAEPTGGVTGAQLTLLKIVILIICVGVVTLISAKLFKS